MMQLLFIFFFLNILLIPLLLVESNVFECRTPAWTVIDNDTELVMNEFQNWIQTWQYDTERCHHQGIYDNCYDIDVGGFGASYALHAIRDFLIALEKGQIFRPPDGYLWADNNKDYCTNGLQSYDCYFHSFSNCNIDPSKATEQVSLTNNKLIQNHQQPYRQKMSSSISLCNLAKHYAKPIQWVMGQLIHYMTRPSADLKMLIDGRVHEILSKIPNNTYMFAAHIRTGNPDQNRKLISLDGFINAIDKRITDIEKQNPDIRFGLVYLASQSNKELFHNETYLNKLYPRRYKFTFINNYHIAEGDKREIELILKDGSSMASKISKFHLTVDFFTDMELFVQAEQFLGGYSSIYLMTTLLRFARKLRTVEQSTCMLLGEKGLICEGTMEIFRIWRWYYPGAFMGGSY